MAYKMKHKNYNLITTESCYLLRTNLAIPSLRNAVDLGLQIGHGYNVIQMDFIVDVEVQSMGTAFRTRPEGLTYKIKTKLKSEEDEW